MFFGVQGLLVKTTIGISSFFTTGVLFKYLGYSYDKPAGISVSCLLAAVCILLGLLVFKNYSLDEEKLYAKP
ncbi:hypothetical protein [Thermosediminibacter litoriperuensis]|uniref:Uncharacterized protein n=1 Tax=Thermosediminibacter litoriperuensis TaxID=291989 RepID=A0A5S5AH16_9FIRM|nr:hypothetical protein [Thermosediminibacter litoriperuensis]TYP49256.1 hypothetical protein LZ11_02182 [Thermosediminibacter litoriperuensis]